LPKAILLKGAGRVAQRSSRYLYPSYSENDRISLRHLKHGQLNGIVPPTTVISVALSPSFEGFSVAFVRRMYSSPFSHPPEGSAATGGAGWLAVPGRLRRVPDDDSARCSTRTQSGENERRAFCCSRAERGSLLSSGLRRTNERREDRHRERDRRRCAAITVASAILRVRCAIHPIGTMNDAEVRTML